MPSVLLHDSVYCVELLEIDSYAGLLLFYFVENQLSLSSYPESFSLHLCQALQHRIFFCLILFLESLCLPLFQLVSALCSNYSSLYPLLLSESFSSFLLHPTVLELFQTPIEDLLYLCSFFCLFCRNNERDTTKSMMTLLTILTSILTALKEISNDALRHRLLTMLLQFHAMIQYTSFPFLIQSSPNLLHFLDSLTYTFFKNLQPSASSFVYPLLLKMLCYLDSVSGFIDLTFQLINQYHMSFLTQVLALMDTFSSLFTREKSTTTTLSSLQCTSLLSSILLKQMAILSIFSSR